MKPHTLTLGIALLAIVTFTACEAQPSRSYASSTDPRSATITADGLQQRLAAEGEQPLVVDVREPHEYNSGHIDGAKLAPLGKVVDAMAGVERDREIILVCRSGNRSGKAQRMLADLGFTSLRNMEGGMRAWETRGYPVAK